MILLAIFLINASQSVSPFCEGFKAGYETAYCKAQDTPRNLCIAPVAPICPVEIIGQDMYSDGFLEGMSYFTVENE